MRGYVRYAVYFAPDADGPLGRFGNAWLGFEPGTGDDLPRPGIKGMEADDIARITAAPSRYGFHGTLMPPFALAGDRDIGGLAGAIEKLAARLKAFEVPAIEVRRIGNFVALAPGEPNALLDELAAACVRGLDDFRAPLGEASIRRHRQAGLTGRQEALLERWGYPYVMEEFRFHLTLSGPFDPGDDGRRERLRKTLQEAVQVFAGGPLGPIAVRDIALFGDPGQGRRFRLLKRYPLG